ncbi:MAG: hypothetical protein ACOCYT_00985 [Chloroflexota bacterium]
MLIGLYFARRRWFVPHHKLVMTGVTLFNWVLILLVMVVSFSDSVAPRFSSFLEDEMILFPSIHLVFGIAGQLLATYLVVRMWFEQSLPDRLKVGNIRRWMRLTLGLWLAAVVFGGITYVVWYTGDFQPAGDAPQPVATEEVPAAASPVPGATEEASQPVTTEEAMLPGVAAAA